MGWAAAILILWGIAVFLLQIFYWLKTGTWPSISALDLFVPFPFTEVRMVVIEPYDLLPKALVGHWHWLMYGSDWAGLKKLILTILRHFPFSLLLVLAGMLVLASSSSADDRLPKPKN